MPHQCTNCGHVFEDGSKEMLSGCPDCGGNKFQYHPGDVPDDQPSTDAEPPEQTGGSVTGAVGRAANRVRDAVTGDDAAPAERTGGGERSDEDASTASTTADAVTAASSADVGTDDSDALDDDSDAPETGGDSAATADRPSPESTADATDAEVSSGGVDAATADTEDTAQASARSEVVDRDSLPDAPSDGRVVKEPDDPDDRPDLEELRDELNDQFESIRIVAPGQYELNLMELYDRQEYIIALQEDGQYVIEVPDAWEADTVDE
ncbi:OapC/ArvC family zinc-ribbon domain-containing protein [Halobacterium yunchengense]|uniref:OapC/ArvC family zinc-ribbon domain-containing protein n=1 Tax=Halobacterium yunchengense TaxID=3108497 RepID=UPI00300BA410